jgi:hypothetical protein
MSHKCVTKINGVRSIDMLQSSGLMDGSKLAGMLV